jgi:hypothetical protein
VLGSFSGFTDENLMPCARSRVRTTCARYAVKSPILSGRNCSSVAVKPPETYPETVWKYGGELLNASHFVTRFLMRSTHQRWFGSATVSNSAGSPGVHQSLSARVVPAGAFHQPGTAPPGRRYAGTSGALPPPMLNRAMLRFSPSAPKTRSARRFRTESG